MSRKVYIEVTTRIIVEMSDSQSVSEFMSDLDYTFTSNTEGAKIIDEELQDYKITDLKQL